MFSFYNDLELLNLPCCYLNSIYTPFSYTISSKPPSTADLLGLDESATNGSRLLHQDQQPSRESIPEIFFFDYGVVVIWGMSEQEETRLLQEISRFEEEKLGEFSLMDGTIQGTTSTSYPIWFDLN